VIVLYFTSY